MNICRLIYCSIASDDATSDDLMQILRIAVDRNGDNGVTGVLAYGNCRFLQILEGERTVVNNTFSRILKDHRHEQVQLIDFRDATSRLFSEWSMKILEIGQIDAVRSVVFKYSAGKHFLPERLSAAQAIGMMKDLASIDHESSVFANFV